MGYLWNECHKGRCCIGPRDVTAHGHHLPCHTSLQQGSEESGAPVYHLWEGGEGRGGREREGREGRQEGKGGETGREGDRGIA